MVKKKSQKKEAVTKNLKMVTNLNKTYKISIQKVYMRHLELKTVLMHW